MSISISKACRTWKAGSEVSNELEASIRLPVGVDLRPGSEHGDEVAKFGRGTHGVVCLGLEDQTRWEHLGHDITQQELDKGVEQVLAALKKN